MIDSKQFIIANTIFKKENWIYMTLSCGKILSYHKELNICHNADNSVILLGHAWSVLPIEEQVPPSSFVENMNRTLTEEEIIQEEKTWCGRYILIANDHIFLDTIGSLGVFYSRDCVCSSIRVMCHHLNIPIVYPKIKHRDAPDFILGMQTGYSQIKRLLPSQILDINTYNYHIRKIFPDSIVQKETESEQIRTLEKYYTQSFVNMNTLLKPNMTFLAITGGRDSRATLAMIEKSGIPYELCTLEHDNISDGDIYIPPKIAKAVNKKLYFIKRSDKIDDKLYTNYQEHCAGFAVDEDWNFYAYKQYQALSKWGENIILLRSSIWEIPNNYYKHHNPDNYDITKIYPDLTKKNTQLNSAIEWVEYAKNDHKNNELNIWNRTLLELRNGCWTSSIEQSLDIIDGVTSIQSCNCRLFLSILFGFNEKERFEKLHEDRIANYLCPQLKDIPYDYQGGYVPKHVQIRRKLKYKEEVLRGKLRDFVYGKILKRK